MISGVKVTTKKGFTHWNISAPLILVNPKLISMTLKSEYGEQGVYALSDLLRIHGNLFPAYLGSAFDVRYGFFGRIREFLFVDDVDHQ